jgi:TonB family protein
MNRVQKKCLMVSTGLHLLLGLMLVLGPAFFSGGDKPDNTPTLDYVPIATVDSAMSGGGDPHGAPPPPAPPQPQIATPPPQPQQSQPPPQPKPPEPVKVSQPPPQPKIVKPSPEAFEPVKEHKHTIEVNTKEVVRNSDDLKAATAAAQQKAAAQAAADAKRRASAFDHALANIKSSLSPSTAIVLQGPGGGGIPYGNFLSAVKKVYTDAWEVPDGVTDNAAATVSVTIARDGTVISARIIDRSGNGPIDKSVQSALDRVKFAAPLPDGAKEDQRTVNIVFDVKSKLLG